MGGSPTEAGRSRAPTRLGRYEVVREIGRGAMGVVYLARDPLIGRHVALKTFRLSYATGEDELERLRSRFIREAQSAGILSQHAGIVTIHDVAEGGADEDGSETPPFIAMEYVEGTDLKQLMRRQGSLDPGVVGEIVSGIADALDYAHAKGVVHRDIKPANVILAADRKIRITDFGIARFDAATLDLSNLTLDGQLLGTPNYMAPEQVVGGDIDHRADIFSLGVITYELLTGRKPFSGENLTAVTHRIVNEPHPPPSSIVSSLPAEVDAAIGRALEKTASRRFSRAGDFASALVAALPSGGSDTLPAFELPPSSSPSASAAKPTPAAAEPQAPASPTSAPPAAAEEHPESRRSNTTDRISLPADALSAGAVRPAPVEPRAAPPETVAPAWRRFTARLGAEAERAGARRLALVAAVALGVALVAAGVLATVPRGIAPAEDPSTDPLPTARLIRLLQLGGRQLAAGDPAAAAATFRRAERLSSDRTRLRSLRQRAEAEAAALGQEIETELASTLPEDFGSPDAPDAVLGSDAPVTAGEPAGSVSGGLGSAEPPPAAEPRSTSPPRPTDTRRPDLSRSELLSRSRAPSGGARGPGSGSAAGAGAASAAAQGEAALRVELVTAQPSGSVVVAVNERRVISRNFAFSEKTSRFGRRKPTGGSLSLGPAEVPAGVVELDVWVAVEGQPAQLTEMTARFLADSTRRLRVDIDDGGVVVVRLE